MINGLGGYGAYSQLPIQEKLTNQRSPQQTEDDSKKTSASSREELFKSLLKASSTDSGRDASNDRQAQSSDPSGSRGQVVDLSV